MFHHMIYFTFTRNRLVCSGNVLLALKTQHGSSPCGIGTLWHISLWCLMSWMSWCAKECFSCRYTLQEQQVSCYQLYSTISFYCYLPWNLFLYNCVRLLVIKCDTLCFATSGISLQSSVDKDNVSLMVIEEVLMKSLLLACFFLSFFFSFFFFFFFFFFLPSGHLPASLGLSKV